MDSDTIANVRLWCLTREGACPVTEEIILDMTLKVRHLQLPFGTISLLMQTTQPSQSILFLYPEH